METAKKNFAGRGKAALAGTLLLSLSMFLFSFTGGNNPCTITICHVPPGNPANCHEITISINALPAHLAHGDHLECHDPGEYGLYLDLAGNNSTLVHVDF